MRFIHPTLERILLMRTEDVYFGKAKDVVGDLRSEFGLLQFSSYDPTNYYHRYSSSYPSQ